MKQSIGIRLGSAALLSSECMSCHIKNDHAFVVLPLPPRRQHSPALDE
jgi:hypothetical protein